jgi:hypothetical protein
LQFLPSSFSGEIWDFQVEGGGVLVRPEIKGLFLLNPTALEIWLHLRNGASTEAAASHLVSKFGISFGVALRDVRLTVHDWQQTLLADPTSPPAYLPACFPPAGPEIVFECRLGSKSFRILLSSRELADEILPRLESLRVPASDPPDIRMRLLDADNCVYIFRGDELLSVKEDAASARVVLLQELVRLSAADGDFLAVLHAGACGSESKCVIFPAATYSGKTTLAAVLMGAGLTLYADDSVALHRESLAVPPMPFALMVRQGSWPVISAHFPAFRNLPSYARHGDTIKFLQPRAEQIGSSVTQACAIVFSQWEADAITRIEPLTTFDALVRLRDCGFWLAHDREGIKQFLDWLQQLPIHEMVYSDVDEAARSIKNLLTE